MRPADISLARLLAAMGLPPVAVALTAPMQGCLLLVVCKDDGSETGLEQEEVCIDAGGLTCPSPEEAWARLEEDAWCELQSVDGEGVWSPVSPGDSGEAAPAECCYPTTMICEHYTCTCYGRPYLGSGDAQRAAARRAEAPWSAATAAPDLSHLDDTRRERLAAWWTEAALAEHASVAGFHRFVLELLAHEAPERLLGWAQRAAIQELDHARRCFALASAYAGHAVVPGPFPVGSAAPIAADLVALAVSSAREGAISETISASVAAAIRDAATDPAVRATMGVIARDEAEHAELAWATLRWALQTGGEPVRSALAEVFGALRAAPPQPVEADRILAAHGLAGSGQMAEAERAALARLVRPAAIALLRGDGASAAGAPPLVP